MTQQLDVCPLLRMAAQIPARQPSLVWKHSLDASLRLWRIETELCLSVLLQHGIVVIHRHRAVSIASARRPHPENGIVQNIGQNDYPNRNTNNGAKDSSQPYSKAWGSCLGHDARLSPCLATRPAPPVPPVSAHIRSLLNSLCSQTVSAHVSLLTLTTPPSGRQTTAFAGNRFWRGSAAVQGRFPAQVL